MSHFDALRGQNAPQPGAITPASAMRQLQADPVGKLKQAGYNVPAGMTSPQEIFNYLQTSGQIKNPAMQMLRQRFGALFGKSSET